MEAMALSLLGARFDERPLDPGTLGMLLVDPPAALFELPPGAY